MKFVSKLLYYKQISSNSNNKTPTVQFLGLWILGVNGDDLPIHFSLIDHGQDAQHFHLDDLTWKTHLKPRTGDLFVIMWGTLNRSRRRSPTWVPISQTSTGSSSPQHLVSLSVWFGSSQVFYRRQEHRSKTSATKSRSRRDWRSLFNFLTCGSAP